MPIGHGHDIGHGQGHGVAPAGVGYVGVPQHGGGGGFSGGSSNANAGTSSMTLGGGKIFLERLKNIFLYFWVIPENQYQMVNFTECFY